MYGEVHRRGRIKEKAALEARLVHYKDCTMRGGTLSSGVLATARGTAPSASVIRGSLPISSKCRATSACPGTAHLFTSAPTLASTLCRGSTAVVVHQAPAGIEGTVEYQRLDPVSVQRVVMRSASVGVRIRGDGRVGDSRGLRSMLATEVCA